MGRSRPRAQIEAPEVPDRDQLVGQAELVAQLGGLGAPGQEGVGGQIDGASGELGRSELAADPVARLEHVTTGAGVAVPARRAGDQLPGRGQPGDPRADDGDGRSVAPGSRRWRPVTDRRPCAPLGAPPPAHHAGEHREEPRVVVEGPGPGEGHPGRPGHARGPRRRGRRGSRGGRRRTRPGTPPPTVAPSSATRRISVEQVGPDPRVGRPPRALPGHPPGQAGRRVQPGQPRRCRRPTRPPGSG